MPLVDGSGSGSLLARVSAVRKQIASELGTVVPTVRIHDEIGLSSHEYAVKVRGVEVARGSVMAGHQLALDPGDAVGQLQGVPTTEPAFGLPALWIPDGSRAEAEALGYTVVDPESVIVTHLTETIRANVAELLTRQDVRSLLDALKEHNAAVVEEVVPELLSVGEIQRVLQALLHENVSIRDLGTIVEAVGIARPELDPIGHDAEAAPERRPRDGRSQEACRRRAHAVVERRARRERAALPRRPRAELELPRPRGEIRVGLGVGHALGAAFDAHLRVGRPVEGERGGRVREELARLAARHVRVEDEPAPIDRFEQHESSRRPPAGVHRREHHRVGLAARRRRLPEPLREQRDRILRVGHRIDHSCGGGLRARCGSAGCRA